MKLVRRGWFSCDQTRSITLRHSSHKRGRGAMASKFGPIVLFSLFLVLTGLGGWCCLLGGASYIQHQATAIATLLNANSAAATYFDIMPMNSPGRIISYEWFKAVLQVLTLLFVAGVLASGQIFRFRMAMIGLLAVLASLWCDSCQTMYYTYLVLNQNMTALMIPKAIIRAVEAFFSGCIISAAVDFGLIIALGTGIGQAEPVDTYAYPKDPVHPVSTTASPAGTI
ncbi:hypothetical protein WJX84_000310 [Apatococcus fuscideae]|uniref:Uncharacterized protein n=1 Tax=Apatococcus fuscideae TaxID=2026836 RepID=A0AAW1T2S1_9CHLO